MTHPATRELLQSAAKQPGFQSLLQRLTRGEHGPFSVSGLVTTAKALYLVLLYQATEKPLFVLVDGNKQAETLLESVEVFFGMLFEGRDLPAPQLIPALDVLPHQRLSPHSEIEEKRAIGLWRLSAVRGQTDFRYKHAKKCILRWLRRLREGLRPCRSPRSTTTC